MHLIGMIMVDSDFRRLQNCACFNVRKTSRMITQLFDHALKPSGIKATQFTLLAVLANEREMTQGTMTIKELSNSLGMERTTLTRGLVRLEREGLIKKHQGDDGRQRFVALTPTGLQRLTDAIPFWEEAQATVEKGLGDNFSGFLATLETAVKSQQIRQ